MCYTLDQWFLDLVHHLYLKKEPSVLETAQFTILRVGRDILVNSERKTYSLSLVKNVYRCQSVLVQWLDRADCHHHFL